MTRIGMGLLPAVLLPLALAVAAYGGGKPGGVASLGGSGRAIATTRAGGDDRQRHSTGPGAYAGTASTCPTRRSPPTESPSRSRRAWTWTTPGSGRRGRPAGSTCPTTSPSRRAASQAAWLLHRVVHPAYMFEPLFDHASLMGTWEAHDPDLGQPAAAPTLHRHVRNEFPPLSRRLPNLVHWDLADKEEASQMAALRKYPIELKERAIRLWRSEQPHRPIAHVPVSWGCIPRPCGPGSARTRPTVASGMTG
jgi:hypothetical protein